MKQYPTEDVVQGIRAGGATQELWLKKIYERHYSLIRKALRKHKITEEKARDAFADAVIELRRKIVDGTFESRSSYFTFLHRIFFYKILNAVKKNDTKSVEAVFELPFQQRDLSTDIARELEIKENWNQLLAYFQQLGKDCQQIILDSEYRGYSMAEIAERLQLKDAGMARSRKFHCLKKLRSMFQGGTSHTGQKS